MGAVRKWKERFQEEDRRVRQLGVAVPGGVEQVAPGSRMLYKIGHWFILKCCSN